MSTAAPATTVQEAFNRLEIAAQKLASAYAQVARLVEEHNALLAEASRLGGTVDTQQVVEMISSYYKVTSADMVAPSHRKRCVEPRQVAIWILRRITSLSAIEVGRMFNRSADTVFLSDRTVENYRDAYPAFRAETDMLLQKARGAMTPISRAKLAEAAS